MPPVQYARSGDLNIAYMTLGSGDTDILITPGATTNIEVHWQYYETNTRLRKELSQLGRVTWFDKRGTGLSDRDAHFTFEERVDDLRAVLDAVGAQRAHLVGVSEGGPLSILFAATHPERAASLTLVGTFPAWRRKPDYP